jgi:hypothetical protein
MSAEAAEPTSLVRIFNESDEGSTTWAMEDVKEYVKQYMVYELSIKDLQEARREWSADYIKSKSLPKKELAQALASAKKDIDMDIVNEIYDNIHSMVSE